ncbi:hepatocellular carcinoma-associated antigen 66 [Massariosphaeria phaeospora]|uniref:Hepatocellular carcinoma-associated antigen 66 n=1 Tax=Massariosphaeria phaeospora TaxID=100035 RepID=A0A7C8MJQ9_9PLEO|nr:hepatocellular carcinoma-associated antigen 66 [Massariosphaeria phaeospora]
MAGPSDKARYYLEQSATELNDLERKKIFSREEISSIARKRSDFEHIINARGSHSSDYVRYIEFEKNVDALRRKRIKRLGVKYKGSGQRSIYFLYNRAVRKFSGDLGLWMQFIEFALKEKAFKRVNEILTSVVRLHPTKPELWIYAANYFMETQADITNARSYMQRGLRFCKNSQHLWLEYAKLETIYVAKIAGRRKILGLDIDRTKKSQVESDGDADMIALPEITAEDINPSLRKEDGVDEEALQNLASAPILSGAIPIAIFDSALKQFQGDAAFAEMFFNMFTEFEQVPCILTILQHVLAQIKQSFPRTVHTVACNFRMQLFAIHPSSPEFPPALRDGLDLLTSSVEQHPGMKTRLSEVAIRTVLPLVRTLEETEEQQLKKVLSSSLRKFSRWLEEGVTGMGGDAIAALAEALQQERNKADARVLVWSGLKQFGGNEKLQLSQKALGT